MANADLPMPDTYSLNMNAEFGVLFGRYFNKKQKTYSGAWGILNLVNFKLDWSPDT